MHQSCCGDEAGLRGCPGTAETLGGLGRREGSTPRGPVCWTCGRPRPSTPLHPLPIWQARGGPAAGSEGALGPGAGQREPTLGGCHPRGVCTVAPQSRLHGSGPGPPSCQRPGPAIGQSFPGGFFSPMPLWSRERVPQSSRTPLLPLPAPPPPLRVFQGGGGVTSCSGSWSQFRNGQRRSATRC